MISTDDLFILGAGSNYDYWFPTANDLRRDIILGYVTLKSSQGIGNSSKFGQYRSMLTVAEAADLVNGFKNSWTNSIDFFLMEKYRQQKNMDLLNLGKKIIFCHILMRENISCFAEDMQEPSKNWYGYLYNELIRTYDPLQMQNKINVITFNYDRSFEYGMYRAVRAQYDFPESASFEDILPFKVHHVYDSLGPLPEQDPGTGIAYGALDLLPRQVGYKCQEIKL